DLSPAVRWPGSSGSSRQTLPHAPCSLVTVAASAAVTPGNCVAIYWTEKEKIGGQVKSPKRATRLAVLLVTAATALTVLAASAQEVGMRAGGPGPAAAPAIS